MRIRPEGGSGDELDYAPTRAFYRARGYQTAAVVRDFYALGDDQVIFSKRLHRDRRN